MNHSTEDRTQRVDSIAKRAIPFYLVLAAVIVGYFWWTGEIDPSRVSPGEALGHAEALARGLVVDHLKNPHASIILPPSVTEIRDGVFLVLGDVDAANSLGMIWERIPYQIKIYQICGDDSPRCFRADYLSWGGDFVFKGQAGEQ